VLVTLKLDGTRKFQTAAGDHVSGGGAGLAFRDGRI
jgi:hypothetical protein